jgi:hypothetical protein
VRHPRRVSGPARAAHSAAAVALPAPGIALPRQRPLRPSAPARSRPSRERTAREPRLAPRAVRAFNGLLDSALLDRLVRGRVWIGLLAFALCGIVAMQLVVLKLNTGIGRTLQRDAQLQRQDAQLGVEASLSSAGDRVEPLAAAAGMTIAAPAALHFVGIGPSDASKAAAALASAVQAPTATATGQAGAAEAAGAPSTTALSTTTGSTAAASTPVASTPAASTSAAASNEGAQPGPQG